MAGSNTTRSGGIIEGINVTPLVDIMLVLLVIFIVTAKIMVTPTVPLDLPTASKADEIQVVFSVTISATGATQVNGEDIDEDATLSKRAAAALAEDRDLRAVIAADGGVAHRRVIATLDALRRAGLTKVAFATQPASEAQASP